MMINLLAINYLIAIDEFVCIIYNCSIVVCSITYGSYIKRGGYFLYEFRATPHGHVDKVLIGIAQGERPHAAFTVVNCGEEEED